MQTPPLSASVSPTPPRPEPLPPRAAGSDPQARDGVTFSDEARRELGLQAQVGPPGPGLGDRGERVQALQEDLLRWMPGWKGHLEADGIYGPQTRKAVEFFKRVYGTGRDGSSLDPRTSELLADVRTGEFWARNPDGQPHNRRLPEMEGRYQKALTAGYPLAQPGDSLSPAEIREVAARDPGRIVRYQGHDARALTWKRFLELEKAAAAEFPGHHLAVTCTTGGDHVSEAHPEGRAVDFVLERDRDGYRPDTGEFDTSRLAELSRDNGFEVLDEYLNDSPKKSGPHMHAEAW